VKGLPKYIFSLGNIEGYVGEKIICKENYPYNLCKGDIVVLEEKLIPGGVGGPIPTNEMRVVEILYFLRSKDSNHDNDAHVLLEPIIK
jgi:hypothetical protein